MPKKVLEEKNKPVRSGSKTTSVKSEDIVDKQSPVEETIKLPDEETVSKGILWFMKLFKKGKVDETDKKKSAKIAKIILSVAGCLVTIAGAIIAVLKATGVI